MIESRVERPDRWVFATACRSVRPFLCRPPTDEILDMSNHPDETGFTLIELMIVVTVIAVIAAIAVPNLLTARAARRSPR